MTSSTRATEQTLHDVYIAVQSVKNAVDALNGQFDSDNVTITSPTDFPDAGANTKLQSVINELQSMLAELQGTLTVNGSVGVNNLPATYPDGHDQPLTDTQLRATDISVDDDAAQAILAALRDSKFGDVDTADTALWELDQVRQELISQSFPTGIFGYLVVSSRHNQIETSFFEGDPATLDEITVSTTGSGDTSLHEGHGHFNVGTSTDGSVTTETVNSVTYRPGHEVYCMFTAGFTTPTDPNNSHQRIGIYNDTDGFFIGYESGSPQITHRSGGAETTIERTAWDDQLTGASDSLFTRNGVPEAINWVNTNIFRIRFGWLGSADVLFEIMSPDGEWVEFHRLHFPNLDRHPSIETPNLPMRLEISKTASDNTDLEMIVGCWAAGTSADEAPITETINSKSLAKLTRAVITAQDPQGDYVNISANQKGRLQVTNDSVAESGEAAPVEVNQIGAQDSGGVLYALRVDDQKHLQVAVGNEPAAIALQASTGAVDSSTPLTISPSAGNALRLWWASVIPDPDNQATGTALLSLGADQLYRSPAFAHRQRFDGAVGEDIVVSISGDGTFDATVHYEEFTP